MAIVDQNEDDEEEHEHENANNMTVVPTTLASFESLTFPLVQEIVLLADFRCKKCQDRVANIVDKLEGEEESVEISLLEKKVTITLTRRHPRAPEMPKNKLQATTLYKNPTNKVSLVRKMFHSSSN
ncbi:uncharacterized protein [Rutidosis leptorrhynchoides]|uniref:uncharacterized protein n=1 Tax=Rutidosis leptorrhynchoides TaxID=125765 RepID=UPI003A99F8A2